MRRKTTLMFGQAQNGVASVPSVLHTRVTTNVNNIVHLVKKDVVFIKTAGVYPEFALKPEDVYSTVKICTIGEKKD